MTPEEKIDAYIAKFPDWRGELLTEIRALVHEVQPEIEEQWKWNSPIFAHGGKMVCSPSAFKKHVSINFFQATELPDPDGLFETSDAKTMRTVKFHSAEDFDKSKLKSLLKTAFAEKG